MSAQPVTGDGELAGAPAAGADRSRQGVQRVFDVALATVAMLVAAPVFLVAWLLVVLTSSGPGLFRQTRVGRNGERFTMFKFRTMTVGTGDEEHRAYVRALLTGDAVMVDGLYKLNEQSRMTRVGAVLRKLSIDELPQLLNVLRGDMSLVGPRPSLPWEAELFPDWSAPRYRVPPGITGLWQVSGRNRLGMLDGLALDVEFVRRKSLWLYVVILAKTVPALLRGGAR